MNNITAVVDAVNIITERGEAWRREHPDQEMEVCPKCLGTGLIRYYLDFDGRPISGTEPGAYEYLKPCSCVKGESQLHKNNKRFSKVPSLYKDALFGNFDVTIYKDVEADQLAGAAKRKAELYVENYHNMEREGVGLYIWSTARGCGKSRLASTICNELTNNGVRNKYVSTNDLISEIQASWNDDSVSEYQVIKKYTEPRLLILDDFGARSGKSWIDDKLFQIIDDRYQDGKPTIITSNYEVERLPFNETRLIDRICDEERYENVKMPQVSVRRLKRGASAFNRIVREDKND